MNSLNLLILFFFLFLVTISEAGKKKSVDKIIIHVPYKIHKHHHTHTKYKVITVPAPKKENTIIYYNEAKQPEVKMPPIQSHQTFIPPHQQSASGLLQALAGHSTKDSAMEAQEASPIIHREPPESESKGKNFIPNFPFNQLHPQFFQFAFQPMMFPHHGAFIPPYSYKPMIPPVEDNVAHSNNQVYKTVIAPNAKPSSYKVKEEVKELPKPKLAKRRPKSHGHLLRHTNVPSVIKPLHPFATLSDQEYEHVGYLIIDGDSRKIVDKNFKEEINLSR